MKHLQIGANRIGPGEPVYIIAEISANHQQNYAHAAELVRAAAHAGANAVKLQTYTADTITLASRRPEFLLGEETLWAGRSLHELYQEASMPWEWQPKLKAVAEELGVDCFSSPFDATAVDFLGAMDVPAWKVASFELVDVPLIRKIASTGKPMILSTGMASLEEIEEALGAARAAGCDEIALLKCTSSYPARFDEMHLRSIPELEERFGVPVGLSDHSPGHVVPVAAVALGAVIVEKHIKLNADDAGPDAKFSLDAAEFGEMVAAIRSAESALGSREWKLLESEDWGRRYRRSLFACREIEPGEPFTAENVRSVRPANGLPPKYYEQVLASRAACRIESGTPLQWSMVGADDGRPA